MHFKKSKLGIKRENQAFYILIGYLILVFLTGGGSRSDISSLVILRPASVTLCGYALTSINKKMIKQYRFPFFMALSIFILVLAQLIPLPPSIWHELPGREIVKEGDALVGHNNIWRPISLTPSETWNAFYSLFVPLAVLLLMVQLTWKQRFKILAVTLALLAASGLWGIVQILGAPGNSAYFYRITNGWAAVGLFANRNHQAVALASTLPMLAVFASVRIKNRKEYNFKSWVALAFGITVLPLLLVTGSRAGLISGIFGLISIVFLYRNPSRSIAQQRRGEQRFRWGYAIAGFAAFCVASVTVIVSRAEALQRLLEADSSDDLRFSTFAIVGKQAWDVFPFGSGYGSFPSMYKLIEPDNLMSPRYFNHAHNDWIELLLTGGLPAVILLVIFFVVVSRRAVLCFRTPVSANPDIAFGRLGAIIVAILALASTADYPLRVPSIMCIFVIALIWMNDSNRLTEKNSQKM